MVREQAVRQVFSAPTGGEIGMTPPRAMAGAIGQTIKQGDHASSGSSLKPTEISGQTLDSAPRFAQSASRFQKSHRDRDSCARPSREHRITAPRGRTPKPRSLVRHARPRRLDLFRATKLGRMRFLLTAQSPALRGDLLYRPGARGFPQRLRLGGKKRPLSLLLLRRPHRCSRSRENTKRERSMTKRTFVQLSIFSANSLSRFGP
jgi:hypothetical protein